MDVFPSRPHNHQEIGHDDGPYKADHHGVFTESRKQLSGAWRVDEVGSDEERAPEEGEVVAETLGD